MKKTPKSRPSAVSSQELVALNAVHSEAALAKERFHHTLTKGHLLKALHDTAKMQAEINQLKAAEAARLAAEQHLRAEQEMLGVKQAKEKAVNDLARDLRDRYSAGEKFAIDPLSGEFLDPEA